ncbi:MAG: methyltransferase domain-containing protein [Actinomycetota bacterium]|nr:methyltransferase domain-containing protein [Actinomycetota bacterium]
MFRSRKRRATAPDDFNVFLHETVRTPHLGRLPAGARTILHGGSASLSYFEWFSANYPTEATRHIGVDAYAGEPEGLPDNFEWVASSLGEISPVEDGSVDLVYGGQVIEHLWPDETAGFLCEAHRVLRPGGALALDSPNREVTMAQDWNHPEHTLEFSVAEILELLELAGFDGATARGLWLCRDPDTGRDLPIFARDEGGAWPWPKRVELGEAHPADSFLWWVDATRGNREPDREAILPRLGELYPAYRRHRLGRFQHETGSVREEDGRRVVRAGKGAQGHLLFGPFVPMPPGLWEARFSLRAGPAGRFDSVDPDEILGWIDVAKAINVTSGLDAEAVVVRELTAADVPPDGEWVELALPFELDETAFAVQFRARTAGRTRLSADLDVDVREASAVESPQLVES